MNSKNTYFFISFAENFEANRFHIGWRFFNSYCSYAFVLYNASISTLSKWFLGANFINKEKMKCRCSPSTSPFRYQTAHSQITSFAINITDTIQRQNVWKLRLICHLKYSLGHTEEESSYKPYTMNNQLFAYLLIVSRNLSLYTKTISFFFHRKLLLGLIPQTTIVADTAVFKWLEIIKYYRNWSTYDHTRIWKVNHKKLQIIALFLLRVSKGPILHHSHS